MDNADIIFRYFPEITEQQRRQIAMLGPLYAEWNQKINVISRKDMDHFYEHHVLHSLAVARYFIFKAGDAVIDVGTGGGFPGIPLAILFPQTKFTLVDSIGKKITVVKAIAADLELNNVNALQQRAELLNIKADYIISRATAPMADLYRWTSRLLIRKKQNGFIVLKGGDLAEELKGFKNAAVHDLKEIFTEPFFETKKLVFVPV